MRNSSNQRRSHFTPASSNSREIGCVVKAVGQSRTSASIAATDNRQIRDGNRTTFKSVLLIQTLPDVQLSGFERGR